jgi:hypothetical protein
MTTKKKAPEPTREQKTEVRKSPDFKSIYVNWIQATCSPYDVLLNLGESSPTERGDVEVEHKVRVVFSPIEAKIAAYIMTKTIHEYERQFGAIVVPAPLSPQMRELIEAQNKEGDKQTDGD